MVVYRFIDMVTQTVFFFFFLLSLHSQTGRGGPVMPPVCHNNIPVESDVTVEHASFVPLNTSDSELNCR